MKRLLIFVLAIFCLISGYGIYKMNQNDWLTGVFFSIGMLGLLASLFRSQKETK